MTVETKTDKELIELWDRLTSQINKGQTAAGTSSIRVLSQIHGVLAKRGFRPKDGAWVKDEEEEATVADEAITESVDETDTQPVNETETQPTDEAETQPTDEAKMQLADEPKAEVEK